MAAVKKVKRNLLPIEVQSDILSRLPVKSLLRFKSVQKSWYSLISSPFFINSHRLQNQNQNDQNQKDNLLVIQTHNKGNIIQVADTHSNVRPTFNNSYPEYEYELVDSFNGLVCVYGQSFATGADGGCCMEYISLWNPALRMNKTIRHRRMSMPRCDAYVCVGFGFHTKTNDFKVIAFTNDRRSNRLKGDIEIYSLSSDSWRNVEGHEADSLRNYSVCVDLKFGVYVSDSPLIPNCYGAYCWVNRKDEPGETRIISFDMGDEVFKEIMLPSSVSETDINNNEYRLFNWKGSVGVVELSIKDITAIDRFCYVWVMKEYGEPKSWTKLCPIEPCHFLYVMVVGSILESDLVLMMCYWGRVDWHVLDVDKLELNSSSTKDIRTLGNVNRVRSFTESLVLLDAKNTEKNLSIQSSPRIDMSFGARFAASSPQTSTNSKQ